MILFSVAFYCSIQEFLEKERNSYSQERLLLIFLLAYLSKGFSIIRKTAQFQPTRSPLSPCVVQHVTFVTLFNSSVMSCNSLLFINYRVSLTNTINFSLHVSQAKSNVKKKKQSESYNKNVNLKAILLLLFICLVSWGSD